MHKLFGMIALVAILHLSLLTAVISKNDCFFAYTKFQALIKSCKDEKLKSYPTVNGLVSGVVANIEERERCILSYYQKFVEECQREAHYESEQ